MLGDHRSGSGGLPDEPVIFLTDIFPPGDMPSAMRRSWSATPSLSGRRSGRPDDHEKRLFAREGRVIFIDEVFERLKLSASDSRTEVIDAIVCEAVGHGAFDATVNRAKPGQKSDRRAPK